MHKIARKLFHVEIYFLVLNVISDIITTNTLEADQVLEANQPWRPLGHHQIATLAHLP